MSLAGQSFISSKQLSAEDVKAIFDRTTLFKTEFLAKGRIDHLIKTEGIQQKVLALVFSEPSTRTRMSFQMAGFRIGMRPLIMDNMAASSISKGESLEDTFANVCAMRPDILVVRYGVSREADELIRQLSCPVINGGIGTSEHPTQALLDAYTILENRGRLEGQKVLFVGDVLHSRVANSNLILLSRLGAEIGYCAPEEFLPRTDDWKLASHFSNLDEAIQWADVVMGLRIQKERHGHQGIGLSIAEYRDQYRVGGDQLKHLKSDGILLHPGPVIKGVEFSPFVLSDPRCKVLDQVTNGVFTRAALLSLILDLEVQPS